SGNGQNRDSENPDCDSKSCTKLSTSNPSISPHSISFALGDERFQHHDFTLADVMPIVWTRQYRSNCYAYDETSPVRELGARWQTPYLQYIYVEDGKPVLVTDEGRLAYCPVTLPLTEAIYDRNEELFWFQPAPNIIEVRRKDHSSLRFVQMASVYRLTVISDAQG